MVRAFVDYSYRERQPKPDETPPDDLDWDMWCGPGPLRPYNSKMHPKGFRQFMDYANGQLGVQVSSARYKEEVQDLELGLDTVLDLHPVSFEWLGADVEDLGFIAEEVAAVDSLMATYDNEGAVQGVKYGQLTAVMAKAIQDLSAIVDQQGREIAELRGIIEAASGVAP